VLNEIRKIRRHVILPGFIHNDDILNYYQIANIVVMPSLCEEAAGKVAMEGMACGKAIICSNGGGLPEYVTNDCGVIVERGDSFTENLSKSIEFLFDNKFLREQMGIKGKLLSSNYMPKRHYFELINLLKN
jgi:glycosyltransferase involved in cell wall biosynthesis